MNGFDFCQNPLSLIFFDILGHFLRIFGSSCPFGTFYQNWGTATFLLADPLTSCKSQKKLMNYFWGLALQTDGRAKPNSQDFCVSAGVGQANLASSEEHLSK